MDGTGHNLSMDSSRSRRAKTKEAREARAKTNEARAARAKRFGRKEARCLDNSKVYNYTTGKCAPCDPCGDGQGRDFSDPASLPRGPDGSQVCPVCRTCPPGSYNNRALAVTCEPCRMNCDSLKRNVAHECTRVGDAVCGSCHKGYFDRYQSTDLPCEKIKETNKSMSTTTVVPVHRNNTGLHEQPAQDNSGYQVDGPAAQRALPQSQSYSHGSIALMVVGGCLSLTLLVVLIGWLVWTVQRKRNSESYPKCGRRLSGFAGITLRGQRTNLIQPASNRNSLSRDNDIEIDADADESSVHLNPGERIATYQRQHSLDGYHPYRVDHHGAHARQELEVSVVPTTGNPHGEIVPSVTDASQLEAMRSVHDQTYNYSTNPCSCHSPNQRLNHECSAVINACSTECILANSEVLRIVATHICHKPNALYHALEVPDADIYQIDDDRARDPTLTSEKENIMKILKRWTEIKGKEATLPVLCRALCDNQFHRITDILVRGES